MSDGGDRNSRWPPSGPQLLQLLTTGFAWSSVVWTAVELGLFDAFDRESDLAAVGRQLGLPANSLRRLLGALVAVGLIESVRPGSEYRLSPVAAATLTRSSAESIVPLVRQNQRHFYELFMHLPAAIRTGRPQLQRWKLYRPGVASCYDALAQQPEEYSLLLDAMDAASAGVAAVVAEQADLTAAEHLVDLGHGGGRLARDLLAMHPALRVSAVDLPAALAIARERANASGVAARMRFVEADLRRPLPRLEAADAVLMSGVISDLEPAVRAEVLADAYSLLRPDGRILISETLFDEGRHGPPMPALLSLCMLLLTGGDNFAPSEVRLMLEGTGFVDVRVHRNADRGVRDLVVGRKPDQNGNTIPG
jgi:SAM-dependent methyltransferase